MAKGVPAKRFVDIEAALRWAFRDELPKRGRTAPPLPASLHVWSPYVYPAGYGETSFLRASSSGESPDRDPGYPVAMGAPHPDAVAIEAAVKGLAAWFGHGFGPDDPAGLMHGMGHLPLRTYIGAVEKEIPKVEVDHVAAGIEAVANMAAIVAVHARAGTRPKWTRELPQPFPDRHPKNGKELALIDETFVEILDRKDRVRHVEASRLAPKDWPDNPIVHIRAVPSPAIRAGRYRQGTYRPLIYRPRPESLVAERAEWAAWRMGLQLIHQALEGRLASIATLSPQAPWRPWIGEGEAHGTPPQLFRAQREEPYRRGPQTREQAAAQRREARRRQLSDRGEEARPTSATAKGARRPGAA